MGAFMLPLSKEVFIMSTPLRALLAEFRNSAKTEREKGNYFERLAADFIKNDHGMAQEYEDAWLYSEWAQLHGSDGRDTGIDVVAKIRGEDSFCAIQCKFYREGHRIQKADIDSFFTASGKRQFSRRLIIDTVKSEGADLGIAWDGDADRCFFIDDTGRFIDGDFMTALLAESLLGKASQPKVWLTQIAVR